MRYAEVERRLARLESEVAEREQKALEDLSDDDLDTLIAEMDERLGPELAAAYASATEDELEEMIAGELSQDEFLQLYRARCQETSL